MSKRLALIIGSSYYTDSRLTKLKTPDADVGALADLLIDPELGGFDDVKLVPNMASHFVRREIANFFSRKNRTDLLLLYFSGHGVLDDRGQLYLAVKDTDTNLLRGTAIPASYITDEMDNSRSQRQVLILDCCHSGAFARGRKSVTGASVQTSSVFEGTGFGRVVLTASDATQYAWEGDQIIGKSENSLFTHFLIEGIQSGNADSRQDGKITVDEIYDYIYSKIIVQTPKQTPGKWSFREQGELILAKTPHMAISAPAPEPSIPPEPVETPALDEFPDDQELLQKRLKKIYTSGLSAYWLEDWAKACKYFEELVEINPDYEDAAEKLEQAKTQKKNSDLYQLALTKHQEGDLDESIKLLESLISKVPDFKSASEQLEEIRKEQKLNHLVSQAKQLYESNNFQAAIKVFENIKSSFPTYSDPEGLLEKAMARQKEIDFQKDLENLYHQALVNIDKNNLKKAKKLLHNIQRKQKGYQDTDKLLLRIDSLLAAKKEAPRFSFSIPEKWANKFKAKTGIEMSQRERVLFYSLAAILIANIIFYAYDRVSSAAYSTKIFFRFDFGWLVFSILFISALSNFSKVEKSDRRRFYVISSIGCILIFSKFIIQEFVGWHGLIEINLYHLYRIDVPWLMVMGLAISRWGQVSTWSKKTRKRNIIVFAVSIGLMITIHLVIRSKIIDFGPNLVSIEQEFNSYGYPWLTIMGGVIWGTVTLVRMDKRNLKTIKNLLPHSLRKEKKSSNTETATEKIESPVELERKSPKKSFSLLNKLVNRFKATSYSDISQREQVLFYSLVAISIATIIYSSYIRVTTTYSSLSFASIFFRFDFGWLVFSILYIIGLYNFRKLEKSDRRRFYVISSIGCLLILLNYFFIRQSVGWHEFIKNNLYHLFRIDVPWLVVIGLVISRWGQVSTWSKKTRKRNIIVSVVSIGLIITIHLVIRFNIIDFGPNLYLLKYDFIDYKLPWLVMIGCAVWGVVAVIRRLRRKKTSAEEISE